MRPSVPDEITNLPLERLSSQDIQMVEDYLRRRYEIANSTALADKIIQTLYQRMELPPPKTSWLEKDKTLRNIVKANRNR